jgi:hypothetical protein
MLRSHVDLISTACISGWAVDSARPDDPVDVSIFVDGRKLAQITCDQLREDLVGRPGLGNGRHGFSYSPQPPLAGAMPKRVTVRYARSGNILGRGDVMLNADTAPPPRDLNAELPEVFQRLPAPQTPRQTLELLSLYDRSQGLYNLLLQLDFTGRSARQLAYAALGEKAHDAAAPPLAGSPEAARDTLNDLLLADLFQDNIIPTFLAAFPEKRRLLFVHIPKCAGSDLSLHLTSRYPAIVERLRLPEWTDKPLLFEALGDAVRHLHFSDSIFVRGHVNLADYLDQKLARPSDCLFTILRDPVEIAISQVNYVLTRLKDDAAAGEFMPDTREWLQMLGVVPAAGALSDDFLRSLGKRALRNRLIVVPNSMCHWLGGGDAASVLARLAEHEVEVTNTRQYSRWRRRRWGVEADTRQNESVKFLTRQTVASDDLAYLNDISVEDSGLYRVVDAFLQRTGQYAVTNWARVSLTPPAAVG